MSYPPVVVAKEISHQAEQGLSRPFFVRDNKDDLYVVKGVTGAGPQALCSELICSELGRRCGLPVADYALMKFPRGMLDFSTEPEANDLAGGLAYASKVVPYSKELTYNQIEQVCPELQQRVLLFDVWVSNEDRYLSDQGGNVNLLWSYDRELVVIDHNVAFDPMTGIGDFTNHVFNAVRPAFQDLDVRARHHSALDKALSDWDTITSFLPDEWVYRDPDDESTAIMPTLDARHAWLARLRESSFWSVL